MTNYVLGFLYSDTHVVLIHKNRPTWQSGKLNGLGGKIEPGETASEAIVREVEEEAGIHSQPQDWRHVCDMRGADWCVYVYAAHDNGLDEVVSLTDEVVTLVPRNALPDNTLGNVRWLLAMIDDTDLCGRVLDTKYEDPDA